MAKKHDHGFEMMAIVAIVAVVGLIIMFMNSGNLSGEAFGGKKVLQFKSYDECADVNCAPDSEHACCTYQVLSGCGGGTTLTCSNPDGSTYPASCKENDRGEPVYSCDKKEEK